MSYAILQSTGGMCLTEMSNLENIFCEMRVIEHRAQEKSGQHYIINEYRYIFFLFQGNNTHLQFL